MEKLEIGIVILAAGSSSRMGQSKQLLLIDDQPMLLKTINTALASTTGKTVVVLGANDKMHRAAIEHLPVEIVYNEHWRNGMGSSLKAGLNFLLDKLPGMDGIVVLVCDQPFLSTEHIQKLIEGHRQANRPIIASKYANTSGVPVFFTKSVFKQLLGLEDDQGAKKMLHENSSEVTYVDFPMGEIDLDTPEDYDSFQKKK
jgi:molybdenum cofactor cytidylyltransferase